MLCNSRRAALRVAQNPRALGAIQSSPVCQLVPDESEDNPCPYGRIDASSAGKLQAVFALGKSRDIPDEFHPAHFLAGVIAHGRRLAAFPLHIMAAGDCSLEKGLSAVQDESGVDQM